MILLKHFYSTLSVLLCLILFISCDTSKNDELSLIPLPNEIKTHNGVFTLQPNSPVYISEGLDEQTTQVIDTFLAELSKTFN